jgi:hypothetical protein
LEPYDNPFWGFSTGGNNKTKEKKHARPSFPYFPVKIGLFWGVGGVPDFFFFIAILLFLLLRSPCKNLESYDNPLLGFSHGGNNKKRKICKIVAYGCQTPSAQHRSDQFLYYGLKVLGP